MTGGDDLNDEELNEIIPDFNHGWRCRDETTQRSYALRGLDESFFTQSSLESRSTWVTFSNATTQMEGHHAFIHVSNTDSWDILDPPFNGRRGERRRRMAQLTGSSVVLVVRVTDSAANSVSQSASELSDTVFGTSGDTVNLASQYAACSGSQLTISAAQGDGVPAGGVYELTLSFPVSGYTESQIISLGNDIHTAMENEAATSAWTDCAVDATSPCCKWETGGGALYPMTVICVLTQSSPLQTITLCFSCQTVLTGLVHRPDMQRTMETTHT